MEEEGSMDRTLFTRNALRAKTTKSAIFYATKVSMTSTVSLQGGASSFQSKESLKRLFLKIVRTFFFLFSVLCTNVLSFTDSVDDRK